MGHTLELSEEKGTNVEQRPLLACIVEQGQVFVVLCAIEAWVDVPIEYTEKNNWKTREDYIIQLNVPLIKDCHCAKATPVGVEIVGKSQGNVFVKEVQDEAGDTCIT